jgi:hypothetical protein
MAACSQKNQLLPQSLYHIASNLPPGSQLIMHDINPTPTLLPSPTRLLTICSSVNPSLFYYDAARSPTGYFGQSMMGLDIQIIPNAQ